MAAHAYWRVLFTKLDVGGDIWLDEVQFFLGTTEQSATGGTALSGGDYSGIYPATQAFDKTNVNSGWASPSGVVPAWIGYQFPAPVDVDKVVLTCENTASASDELPQAGFIFIEYSDDGIAWTSLGALTQTGTASVGAAITLTPYAAIRPPINYKMFNEIGDSPLFPGGFLSVAIRDAYESTAQLLDAPPTAKVKAEARAISGGHADVYFGGTGTITGNVKEKHVPFNLPLSRRVLLIDDGTRLPLREVWSDPASGVYTFKDLDKSKTYTTVAFDHTGTYRALTFSGIVPK